MFKSGHLQILWSANPFRPNFPPFCLNDPQFPGKVYILGRGHTHFFNFFTFIFTRPNRGHTRNNF